MRLYVNRLKFLPVFVTALSFCGNPVFASEPVTAKISLPRIKNSNGESPEINTKITDSPQEISNELAKPGIVYLGTEVKKEIETKLPDENFIPVEIPTNDGKETIGYAIRTDERSAKNLEQAISESRGMRLLMAVVGASISATGVIAGKILAGDPDVLESLSKVAGGWTISFLIWYCREGYSTIFNYNTPIPKIDWNSEKPLTKKVSEFVIAVRDQYRETKRLKKEMLITGVRPQGLKDGSPLEQLTKLYALEVFFMFVVDGIPLGSHAIKSFIETSLAYTAITTYDLIVVRKRDNIMTTSKLNPRFITITANLISMVITSAVNVAMISSVAGAPWAVASIWTGAILFNVYYFWGPLKSQLANFRDRLFGAPRNELLCSNLF